MRYLENLFFLVLTLLAFTGDGSADTSKMKINFPEKVIVLLTEHPNPNDFSVKLQDFSKDGRTFFPVFSTKLMYEKSIEGKEMPFPKFEFDRAFLLSLLSGSETIILDLNTENEAAYSAKDLITHYADDIARFKESQSKNAP